MAAGPATRISDVIVPDIFTPYAVNLTTQKSRIIQSGMAVRDPFIDNLLAGEGLTWNIPAWRDLDDDPERISNDSSAPFNVADAAVNAAGSGISPERPPDPRKIGTLSETAVRLSRNNSWSSMDLITSLIAQDPMDVIASRVAAYWTRRLQAAFVATWTGVLADNAANDDGDYTNDLSTLNGGVYQEGLTDFSAGAFLDATLTMGDSMDELTGVMVHSVVFNRMQKNNLIDFIPDSEGRVVIPTFLGREVVIDDSMPRNGSVYESWIFGQGAVRLGMGSPKVPTEVERKPGGGNGGGQEVLYNRVEWAIHPTGHSWVGTAPNGGPANTGTAGDDLDEAGSWDRAVPDRKQVRFARLITREA